MTDAQLEIILAEFKLVHQELREMKAAMIALGTDVRRIDKTLKEVDIKISRDHATITEMDLRVEQLEEDQKPKQ